MKKFVKNFLFVITVIITFIAGIVCLTNVRKNMICNTAIKSESLSASERDSMKHTNRNVRMIYTYVYDGKMYVGEQYTTKEKLNQTIDNNELVVYISDKDPSVSMIDRKMDIIYMSFSEFVFGILIIRHIIYSKQKSNNDRNI